VGLPSAQPKKSRTGRPPIEESEVGEGRLAETLDCDRSNVTGIVGRLEARGLVERRMDPSDRRVKNLVLTETGRRQRRRLLDRLAEPPAGICALPREEQMLLQAILRRAFAPKSER
jgi:DNA-binding MarR family transcriptional regulator